MLCGPGFEHRKQWIEERLELLSHQFAIAVCGFAVMDNHLHVLVRLDPGLSKGWLAEEVVRRWIAVYPPKTLDLDDSAVVDKWVKHQAKDKAKIETLRERLQNLGWFMKALKEPLARMANGEDECTGTFWEGRYKSIAILDEESLLATCVYIDLNPVAAGISKVPETSPHTSLRQRVIHAKVKGKLDSHPASLRTRIGCVRWTIGAGKARIAKGGWRVFHWVVISCWWTTRVVCGVREKPKSPQRSPAFLSDWTPAPRFGDFG